MTEQRDILADFTHLREAAMEVATLINDSRAYMTSPHIHGYLELEARLGKLTNGKFNPNLGHNSFCTVLQLLESYPRWSRVSAWHEIQDVFFMMDLPCDSGSNNSGTGIEQKSLIRTSVGEDSENGVSVTHCHKQKLNKVDMEMRTIDSSSCSVDLTRNNIVNGFDARISVSLEKSIPLDLLPIAVVPEFVRIKQRKRFFLASLGIDKETFCFDATIVFSGKTKSEAEQNQNKQENPSFEIEIECLQPKEYLKSCGEDIMLALSLILKCHDFSAALNSSSEITYIPVK